MSEFRTPATSERFCDLVAMDRLIRVAAPEVDLVEAFTTELIVTEALPADEARTRAQRALAGAACARELLRQARPDLAGLRRPAFVAASLPAPQAPTLFEPRGSS